MEKKVAKYKRYTCCFFSFGLLDNIRKKRTGKRRKNKKRCFLGGFFFRPLKMLGEIQIKIIKELTNELIYSNRKDKKVVMI